MATQKQTEHKHVLHPAYKKDEGVPSNEKYTKGTRWLLLWVCKCGYKTAYDITHEEPYRAVKEKPGGEK